MKNPNITIVGLGLMGGSICKALKSKLNMNSITVIDKNPDNINAALNEGTIIKGASSVDNETACADIIFICTPVEQTIRVLKDILPHVKKNCIITDTGSTKQQIVKEACQIMPSYAYFIGGHPMVGSEKSGYMAASAHLFENAFYVLTPGKEVPVSVQKDLQSIIQGMGAIPVLLDAELHDKTVAAISHIPHIISAGLVNMAALLKEDNRYIKKLAAGGFKDITRISSSNPVMWRDICSSNCDEIKDLLDRYISILKDFYRYLENNDTPHIYNYFHLAKDFRTQIPEGASGLFYPLFEIIADVEDKPGIIGEISTLLGKHNINIKNMNIINSREEEPGCLKISFQSKELQKNAYNTLLKNGYKCYFKD